MRYNQFPLFFKLRIIFAASLAFFILAFSLTLNLAFHGCGLLVLGGVLFVMLFTRALWFYHVARHGLFCVIKVNCMKIERSGYRKQNRTVTFCTEEDLYFELHFNQGHDLDVNESYLAYFYSCNNQDGADHFIPSESNFLDLCNI